MINGKKTITTLEGDVTWDGGRVVAVRSEDAERLSSGTIGADSLASSSGAEKTISVCDRFISKSGKKTGRKIELNDVEWSGIVSLIACALGRLDEKKEREKTHPNGPPTRWRTPRARCCRGPTAARPGSLAPFPGALDPRPARPAQIAAVRRILFLTRRKGRRKKHHPAVENKR